ncbi:hypothetical protein RHMOL_Rhmol13G0071100 [Rhododendron molle]|uniref:Uncharacterized protein n=1 Tax=Rhododendron molle TaxID=49168 RepID=A0ACC0L5D1_RHOML|nr:hypothetical protein RHMOL_Rhmol13G0071100 [Rhododendron molle]
MTSRSSWLMICSHHICVARAVKLPSFWLHDLQPSYLSCSCSETTFFLVASDSVGWWFDITLCGDPITSFLLLTPMSSSRLGIPSVRTYPTESGSWAPFGLYGTGRLASRPTTVRPILLPGVSGLPALADPVLDAFGSLVKPGLAHY